jgi:hypothetical protein
MKQSQLRTRTAPIIGLLSLLASSPGQSQTLEQDVSQNKGFHAERLYFSPEPFEHVDPVTGNVLLAFTDLVLPGNAGRRLEFQRTFNNQPRGLVLGVPQTSRWSFGFPGVVMQIKMQAPPSQGEQFPTAIEDTDLLRSMILWHTPLFVMGDGSVVRTIYTQRPVASNPQTMDEVISPSFYKYRASTGILSMPDGTECEYDAQGRLRLMRDPFDNTVEIEYSTEMMTVTQNLGNSETRVVTFALDSVGRPQNMAYLGRTWTFNYIGSGNPIGAQDINEVILPDGLRWQFGYDSDLTSITTPQGGTIAHTYEQKLLYDPLYPNDPNRGTYVKVLRTRTTNGPSGTTGGTWTLNFDPDQPGQTYLHGGNVTTPSGDIISTASTAPNTATVVSRSSIRSAQAPNCITRRRLTGTHTP